MGGSSAGTQAGLVTARAESGFRRTHNSFTTLSFTRFRTARTILLTLRGASEMNALSKYRRRPNFGRLRMALSRRPHIRPRFMTAPSFTSTVVAGLLLAVGFPGHAQTLLNVDFGAGVASAKSGPAATGLATNDFWNLYRHYEPRFLPGMALVSGGRMEKLKLADGTESSHQSPSLSRMPPAFGATPAAIQCSTVTSSRKTAAISW
jgi:hypothetical protein